jgi:hypothetical protein
MDCHLIIQNCLEILLTQLEPVIHSTTSQIYGNDYLIYLEYGPKAANLSLTEMKDYAIHFNHPLNLRKYKDLLFYLNSIIKNWETLKGLFKTNYVLCLCHSLKYFRNKWAHQSKFTKRELHRFIDECQVLLEEFDVKSDEIDLIRKHALEAYYHEEVTSYSQVIGGKVNQTPKQDYILSNQQNTTISINQNSSYIKNSFNMNLNKDVKENGSNQVYKSYYNDFSNSNLNSNYDHDMSENFEGNYLDENYYGVINDKEKVYKDYKIYIYDQEKEDRESNYKN